MGIKSFIKENFPIPIVRVMARLYYPSFFIRERRRRREMESIIARAEKFRPYYQDELSHEILSDREKYLITRDVNIFLERALKEGVKFETLSGFFWANPAGRFSLSKEKYSCVAIIYDRPEQLGYSLRLFEACGWGDRFRLISFEDFMKGAEIHESELADSVLSEKWQIELATKQAEKKHIPGGLAYVDGGFISSAQYFDVFRPTENEIVVDAGSYNGVTAIRFLEWGGGKVKHVYSFEFDPENVLKCREKLAPYSDKITLIEKGTWDREETLRVKTNGTSSSNVLNEGDIEVHLTTIDSVVKDEPVTFIKMDVEGAELKSLMGAKNTIIQNRPRLAICVYHKPEDIYEIPEYILSLVPEYKFYLRHYSSTAPETILYAYCE